MYYEIYCNAAIVYLLSDVHVCVYVSCVYLCMYVRSSDVSVYVCVYVCVLGWCHAPVDQLSDGSRSCRQGAVGGVR